ncbi:hypothetical protein ORF008R [Spotted knifejaw iridovirus]|nr:hypothetical protein ORF008R [Spotted knifejaw iridovirus]
MHQGIVYGCDRHTRRHLTLLNEHATARLGHNLTLLTCQYSVGAHHGHVGQCGCYIANVSQGDSRYGHVGLGALADEQVLPAPQLEVDAHLIVRQRHSRQCKACVTGKEQGNGQIKVGGGHSLTVGDTAHQVAAHANHLVVARLFAARHHAGVPKVKELAGQGLCHQVVK